MNVYDKAHELAWAMKASEQYLELKKAKDAVDRDETNQKIVANWRELQFEAQRSYLLQQDLPEDKKKAIEDLHKIVESNATVRDYLHKELRYAQLAADIQKILGEAMEL